MNAISKSAQAYTKLPGPFGQGKGFPVIGDKVVVAPVVGLFKKGRPSAIVWLIVAIIVDAIYRMFGGRARSHIRIERLVGFKPSFANADTAAAITTPILALSVCTSGNHFAPNVVFGNLVKPVDFISRWLTPTAFRRAVLEAVSMHGPFGSALATAKPSGLPVLVATDIAQNKPFPKVMAGYIMNSLGYWYNLLSHVRTSFTNVMRGLMGVRCTQQSPLFYHNTVISSMVCQI